MRKVRQRVCNLVFVPARRLPFDEDMVAPERIHEAVEDSARGRHATCS